MRSGDELAAEEVAFARSLRAGRVGAETVHAMEGLGRVGPPSRDEVADELAVAGAGDGEVEGAAPLLLSLSGGSAPLRVAGIFGTSRVVEPKIRLLLTPPAG
jgi:hypothetical protein